HSVQPEGVWRAGGISGAILPAHISRLHHGRLPLRLLLPPLRLTDLSGKKPITVL
ncbi:unnamed protein product, partial [Closterium sp. NIES-54]